MNSEIGRSGESIACAYLVKKGYKTVDRNFKRKFGEIDIIARANDKTLVFCEVKTMVKKQGIPEQLIPEDNLTFRKAEKMKRIAQFFAAKYPDLIDDDKGWRIDLVVVVLGEDLGKGYALKRITHYENL